MVEGDGSINAWRHPPVADRPVAWPLLLILAGGLAATTSILWAVEVDEFWLLAIALAATVATCAAASWMFWARHRADWRKRGPRISMPVTGLVVGLVVLAFVEPTQWVVVLVGTFSFPLAIIVLGLALRNEVIAFDIAAVAAIVAVVTTVAWLVFAIADPATEEVWLQVLALLAGVVLSMVLVALDWSRVGLYLVVVVTAALLVAYLTRVGYQAEIADRYDEPAIAAQLELDRLIVSAELGPASTATSPTATTTPVRASSAPDTTVPAAAEVEEAFDALCVQAESDDLSLDVCDRRAEGGDELGDDLGGRLAAVERELASYRFELDPSDDNRAALLAIGQDVDPIDVDLIDAVAAAPGAIVDSIDPDGGTRIDPGPFGWFLLLGAAVVLARWMFKLNARQGPGPVIVEGEGDHMVHFRLALLSNVAEPEAAPGAALNESLTGLTSVTPAAKGVVEGIAAAINVALARKRGFVATCEIAPGAEQDADGDADAAEPVTEAAGAGANASRDEKPPPRQPHALVRLTRAGSGRVVATKRFRHADAAEAVRRGGTWAAGRILAESSRLPTWAQWDAGSIGALEVLAAGQDDSTVDRLALSTRAARRAPTSGLVLVRHQYQLAAAGRHVEATVVAARAVALHPRHLEARNHLALCLSTLVTREAWRSASNEQRQLVGETVRLACDRLGLDPRVPGEGAGPPVEGEGSSGAVIDDEERQWTALARTLWESIRVDVRPWRRWSTALRRTERNSAWIGWRLGRTADPALTRTIAATAALIDTADDRAADDPKELRRLTSWAHRDRRSFVVAYNLACAAAHRRAVDEALLWLHRTQLHDDARLLTRDAVADDPDLVNLRGAPRFGAFLEDLDAAEKGSST